MKTLIVSPAWIGDMVMSQSLVARINAAHANAEVHLLAPPSTAALGKRMPGVRSVAVLDVRHGELGLRKRFAVGKALRGLGFDRAIVLPNSFKSALAPAIAGIATRTGWRGEMRFGLLNDIRLLDETRLPLMVERFVALASDAGASVESGVECPRPRLQADADNAERTRLERGLSIEKPVLALCPGAEFGPAKRWPARHFGAVAVDHVRRGGSVWLLGGAADAAAGHCITQDMDVEIRQHVEDLTGSTSLEDVIDLLSLSSAVVSNDSGLMHVAAALGVPLVALYGSTSPTFTPPLAGEAVILSESLSCSPCFARICPLGHTDCLEKLAPSRVTAALADLIRW